jgi:hypothetical protein
VRTAATGRKLNISSDARYRFERGLDPAFVRDGLEIATRLMLDLCGGEASEIVTAGAVPNWRRRYVLRSERPAALGGLDVPPEESAAILTVLGFVVERAADGEIVAEPPSWRGDIIGEADLVEEVLRVKGYDQIPAVPLDRDTALSRPSLNPEQRRAELVRRTLAARGLVEAGASRSSRRVRPACSARPELRLVNPISADLDMMRPRCCRGSSRPRGAMPIADLLMSRCSSSARFIATIRRTARRWWPPGCAAGRPATSTGASRRAQSISTMSRPTRSLHSERWALRRKRPGCGRSACVVPPGAGRRLAAGSQGARRLRRAAPGGFGCARCAAADRRV